MCSHHSPIFFKILAKDLNVFFFSFFEEFDDVALLFFMPSSADSSL